MINKIVFTSAETIVEFSGEKLTLQTKIYLDMFNGRILHCTSRFSSARLLTISLIFRRFWFPLAGLAAYIGFNSVFP